MSRLSNARAPRTCDGAQCRHARRSALLDGHAQQAEAKIAGRAPAMRMCMSSGPRKRFPFADGRRYTPSDAPKEMLFKLHERLGIQHCVIVQPACHGHRQFGDSRCDRRDRRLLQRRRAGAAHDFRRRAQTARRRRPVRRALPLHGRISPRVRGIDEVDRLRQAARRYRLALANSHGRRADRRPHAGAQAFAGAGRDRPYRPHRCLARTGATGIPRATRADAGQECVGESERLRSHHASRSALFRRGAVRAQAGRRNSATAASGAPTGRIPTTGADARRRHAGRYSD